MTSLVGKMLNVPAILESLDLMNRQIAQLGSQQTRLLAEQHRGNDQSTEVSTRLSTLDSQAKAQEERLDAQSKSIGSLAEKQNDVLGKLNLLDITLTKILSQTGKPDSTLAKILASQANTHLAVQALDMPIDSLIGEANSLKSNGESILRSLNELDQSQDQRFSSLQRTAPGRGNLPIGDSKLLIRASIPSVLSHRDPILFVNSDDKLIVPRLAMDGHYELNTTLFVGKTIKPGDHVIDVGANFGYYTVIFAMLTGWKGKVLAFEPHGLMFELLSENIMINWIDQWTRAQQVACTDENGSVEMFSAPARAANTGPRPMDAPAGTGADFEFTPFSAASVRLDDEIDWVDGRVDFLKIDVEGFEPLVISGARKLIKNNPQIVILMEWSPGQLINAGHEIATFAKDLQSLGLSCSSIEQDGSLSVLSFDELVSGGSYQNIVLKVGN